MKVLKGFAKNFSGYKRSWGSLVDLKIFKKKISRLFTSNDFVKISSIHDPERALLVKPGKT